MARGVPKKKRIASTLRERIKSGDLPPDAKLPSQPALAAEWNAAIETVRAGLGILRDEGLIEARRPHGWFVRRRETLVYRPQAEVRALTQLQNAEPFVAQLLAEDRAPSQSIEVSIVIPPPHVAERLRLTEGEWTVLRQRIRHINSQPINLNDSYYPLSMVEGTAVTSPTNIPQGVSYVLAQHGYIQARAVDEIDVRMPTPEERDALDIGPGTPVAIHLLTTYTTDDQPVRCTITTLPGDRTQIRFDREWQ